jgi:hypothetical protein
MPTATFNKFQQFVEDVMEGVHTLSTGALTLALTTQANIPVATNEVLANLTEVAYTNLSTRILAGVSAAQVTGTFKLDATDHVLTATGAVATFRHLALYNDTPSSPADPLIAHFDYGSDVTLADGETLTVAFNAGGIFTLV